VERPNPRRTSPYKEGLEAHEGRLHKMALVKGRARSNGAPHSSAPLSDRTRPI